MTCTASFSITTKFPMPSGWVVKMYRRRPFSSPWQDREEGREWRGASGKSDGRAGTARHRKVRRCGFAGDLVVADLPAGISFRTSAGAGTYLSSPTILRRLRPQRETAGAAVRLKM